MGEGTEFDSWFDKDELEPCPSCGEPRLVPGEPQQGFRVCLDCGIVEVREEEEADVAAHGEPCEPSPE